MDVGRFFLLSSAVVPYASPLSRRLDVHTHIIDGHAYERVHTYCIRTAGLRTYCTSRISHTIDHRDCFLSSPFVR
ncbi:hypothetical protein L227DRAFT_575286 [Lentinus tigrinus ALCF2SS1-6]|uniref:Uncharacterized protein n=1 Tax=Lentinus tigrinus ALCF2SS1-6 TaxID=1328759 RepID=A0A5C2S8R8_9APHY|nr:hypothetical protein L227DRAFT_575286 [Lentinus tigrinus ALCF2SS1-6]